MNVINHADLAEPFGSWKSSCIFNKWIYPLTNLGADQHLNTGKKKQQDTEACQFGTEIGRYIFQVLVLPRLKRRVNENAKEKNGEGHM